MKSFIPLLTLPFLIHNSMPSLSASFSLAQANRPVILGGSRRNQRQDRKNRRRRHAAGDKHAFCYA